MTIHEKIIDGAHDAVIADADSPFRVGVVAGLNSRWDRRRVIEILDVGAREKVELDVPSAQLRAHHPFLLSDWGREVSALYRALVNFDG